MDLEYVPAKENVDPFGPRARMAERWPKSTPNQIYNKCIEHFTLFF